MSTDNQDIAVRHPTLDEVPQITELLNAAERHDFGEEHYTVDDVRDEFAVVDPYTDAWVVDGPDGRPAAFANLTKQGGGVRYQAEIAVRPELRGRGIGSAVARLVEARARQRVGEAPEGVQVILRGWVKGGSPSRRWAEGRGFVALRQALRMDIEMEVEPPPAVAPEGIRIRSFVRGADERATYEALEAAFSDHWGHVPMSFEEWLPRLKSPTFDPDLWLLAHHEGDVVGTCLGIVEPSSGWVTGVGTIRAWRGRGVATALMREILVRFWQRGVRKVGLGVDSDSLTGATRLYERLGMRVTDRFEQMTKVLREGRDVSTQELSAEAPAT